MTASERAGFIARTEYNACDTPEEDLRRRDRDGIRRLSRDIEAAIREAAEPLAAALERLLEQPDSAASQDDEAWTDGAAALAAYRSGT